MHSGGSIPCRLPRTTAAGRAQRETNITRLAARLALARPLPSGTTITEFLARSSGTGAGMRQMTVWVIVVLVCWRHRPRRGRRATGRRRPAPIDFPSADFLFGPPARNGRLPRQLAVCPGRQRLVLVRHRPAVGGQDRTSTRRGSRPTWASRSAAGPRPSSAWTSTRPRPPPSTATSWTTTVCPSRRPRGCAPTSLTGSVKYTLVARGLEVSRLAWVPRHVVPYVGAGGGALHYDLRAVRRFHRLRGQFRVRQHVHVGGLGPGGAGVRRASTCVS